MGNCETQGGMVEFKSAMHRQCIDKSNIWEYSKRGGDSMAATNITMRMDEDLKAQAEELFADLGLNMTSAFTIFVKQAIREQRIPFRISREVPNEETLEAIEEVKRMKKDPSIGKSYTDVDEMMRELLA